MMCWRDMHIFRARLPQCPNPRTTDLSCNVWIVQHALRLLIRDGLASCLMHLKYEQGYTPTLAVAQFKTIISLGISMFLMCGFLVYVAYTTYAWVLAPVLQSGGQFFHQKPRGVCT